MVKTSLPDGLTYADVEEIIRQRERERRREDYARHPERNLRQRITTCKNFLRKQGCFVMDGIPPAPPWTELQQKAILKAIATALEKGGAAQ